MKFTIYSKQGCPFCVKIQNVLQLLKMEYTVYKLNVDFNKEQFYEKFGNGSTFPQVILNENEKLGGCSDTIAYLKENKII
jgi:glutaredoxin